VLPQRFGRYGSAHSRLIVIGKMGFDLAQLTFFVTAAGIIGTWRSLLVPVVVRIHIRAFSYSSSFEGTSSASAKSSTSSRESREPVRAVSMSTTRLSRVDGRAWQVPNGEIRRVPAT